MFVVVAKCFHVMNAQPFLMQGAKAECTYLTDIKVYARDKSLPIHSSIISLRIIHYTGMSSPN